MQHSQIISRAYHAQKRWLHCASYANAATEALVNLTAAELPSVAMFAPIAFVIKDDAYIPVAVLALQTGNCLFVTADGQWTASYIPSVIRAYPFHLMRTQEGQQVCIHDNHCLHADSAVGERFFDEEGQPSSAFQKILDDLTQVAQGQLAAQSACSILHKHKLIRPWQLTLKTDVGEQQLAGLFRIDEAVLNQLPGDVMIELRENGALTVAYCQLLSMQHFARLGELEIARVMAGARRVAEQKYIPITNPNPALQANDMLKPLPLAAKVLLVTFQWSTLVEMPHLVKQAGFHVDVLCPSNNPTIRSGFFDHWIDSGPTMETLLALLAEISKTNRYQYILIGDDPILWQIFRQKLTHLWHFLPILNQNALSILNKVGFMEHCRDHGIPSPKFHVIVDKTSADDALDILGLPIVVKENYSNGGAGVRIYKEAQLFIDFIESYNFSEPLLAQQFIQGELLGIEALFKRGKLLEYSCSVDVNPSLGPSTKRRYFPNDEEIGASISRFGKTAMLHGFANISIIRQEGDQGHFLFEVDPRPNKWVPYAKWFGHDFVPAFKTFMAPSDDLDIVSKGNAGNEQIDCWEVEHFPTHAVKLLNEGKLRELFIHLLDFKLNTRYAIYDPVLLEQKMDSIIKQIKPHS